MQKTLKNNLRIGLGLSLLLLFISSLASYISIGNLIQSSKMVSHSNQVITNLDEIISTLKDAETGQRGYLLTGDDVFLQPYTGAKQQAVLLLSKVENQTRDNAFQQENIKKLSVIIESRLDIIEKTIVIRKAGGTVSIGDLLTGKEYMDNARKVIKTMETEERNLLASRTAAQNRLAGYTPSLIILAAFLAIIITIFFYRKVSSDFSARIKLQQELQEKNEETDHRIEVIQGIAEQISNGDYQIRLDEEEKDGLGSLAGSLNAMAESLQYSFTLLADKEWLQTGIANLNDKMVGEKSVTTLAADILENIIQHIDAQVAAFYLLEDDHFLYLKGSYALLEEQKKEVLKSGEGLAGQAVKSGRQILLSEIPDNELTISYATGNTRPKNIVAVPVFRDRTVVGVVEIGSLNVFTQLQLDFLNAVSANIGIAIHVAQNRKKLQDFLEETQAQAEELQSQHSELEGLNSELEAQTQKIQTSEEELRVQQEELLQSNQELEERTMLLEEKNQLIQEHNLEIQRKSEQLEQSTKYKSEFLANMSHELRTPLNSILLLSKLMSDNKDLDAEYVEYADVIQSSGQGLLGLIDEILDLSKIEAGKMKLELADVGLNEVTTDMRSLFNPIAKNKNLELRIELEDHLPFIYTDKMRLEQILKNLLSNAIKFTPKGSVTLAVKSDPGTRTVFFHVTDTGIGIPAAKQALVFEAFQQADGSTRRRFGGTGLGLSISRELAKLLGGEIELRSEENS